MPSPASVTEERLPRLVLRTTVAPPEVRLLSLTSLEWTVIVEVVAPLARIEAGLAVRTVWPASAEPGVKVTVAGVPIATPLSVPVTCATPTVLASRVAV